MKKFLFIALLVLSCSTVFAQGHFIIADSTGDTLIAGDQIQIASSNIFPASYWYSDAYYHMYYQGTFIARIHVPFENQHFDYVTPYITGYGDFYVGEYTWCDSMEVEIALAGIGKPQYHFYSSNSLPITPTTIAMPSTSTWSLILLIMGLSVILLRRR